MFSADSQSVASAAAFAGCDGDQLSPQSRLVAARCTLFVSRLLIRSGPSLARHSRPLVMKRAELLIPPAAGQHCPCPFALRARVYIWKSPTAVRLNGTLEFLETQPTSHV